MLQSQPVLRSVPARRISSRAGASSSLTSVDLVAVLDSLKPLPDAASPPQPWREDRIQEWLAAGNNAYQILDIPQNASPEEISRAFRKVSLRCHPDKTPNHADAA